MRKSQIIKKVSEIAESMFKDAGPCHDFYHTKRVLKVAKYLAKREGADQFVVELAALLHDIGRIDEAKAKNNGKDINHAEVSAIKSRMLLKQFDLADETIKNICHAILAHRFRVQTEKPKTIEAKVLRDADKLDGLGAIGVARAYIWLGEYNIGQIYISRKDWSKFDINSDDSKHDSLQREWTVKLSKIKNQMFTKSGKKLAQKRHNTMKKFIKDLEMEIKVRTE